MTPETLYEKVSNAKRGDLVAQALREATQAVNAVWRNVRVSDEDYKAELKRAFDVRLTQLIAQEVA